MIIAAWTCISPCLRQAQVNILDGVVKTGKDEAHLLKLLTDTEFEL